MEGHRATQQDVADRLGVSRSTVSLVFKNHPAVAEKTKQRVLAAAKALGYTPDPMLAALAVYRHRHQPVAFHGNLGWLVNDRSDFEWRTNLHFGEYFAGAKTRAKQHGYQLDVLEITPRGMSPARVASIMRARNIRGVLLCPQPADQREMSFPWDDFTCVTFGHSLVSPRLHMVTAAHFHAVRQSYLHLAARGFTRIGLAIAKVDDARVDNAYLSAYLGQAYLQCGAFVLPPFLGGHDTWGLDGELHAWLRTHQPDAILTNNFRILPILARLGLRVPNDVAVVCASLPKADPQLTGVVEDSFHMGEVAVDFIVGRVHQGARGLPPQPHRIHVEGRWNAGASVGLD